MLDNPTWRDSLAVALGPTPPKPDFTLPNLSYLLRHREEWPAGFKWDFSQLQTCACGLAAEYWGLGHGLRVVSLLETKFHMSLLSTGTIFGSGWDSKTPEDVADQLDLYLEEGPGALFRDNHSRMRQHIMDGCPRSRVHLDHLDHLDHLEDLEAPRVVEHA